MDASRPDTLVSIIVVSFNTREMTLACLRTVVAQTTVPYELIVIDNASSDGSAEAIAAEFPDIRMMAETDNHGFAKANNIAAKDAVGEYLLLLNPDTLVLDGAIDVLLGFAGDEPQAGIWGGKTLYGDHSLNPGSCWGRMTLWNVFCRTTGLTGIFSGSEFFNGEAYGAWDRSTQRRVDIVSGCFFLLKRKFWEELGGFDLSYVMYGEEADLCHRAVVKGADPQVTPNAVIVHYGGASEAVRSDMMVRLFRAKITLINRHFAGWSKPLARWLFRLWPFTRALASRLRKRDGDQSAWLEIWQRRDEWQDGYPRITSG